MDEQQTILTLHHMTSSISFPVLMALEEANILRPNGLKYELKVYPRQNKPAPAALKEFFPLGKSPIMVVRSADNSNKKEVLVESRYLVQYISGEYADDKLSPTSPVDKKREAFMREFIHGTLLSKVGLTIPFDMIPSMLPWGLSFLVRGLFSPLVNHFLSDLSDIYKHLEDNLSDQQPWLSGERFGITDILALFPMTCAIQRHFAWDSSEYPRLAKWYDAITSRPSYQAALARGGPFDLVNFA